MTSLQKRKYVIKKEKEKRKLGRKEIEEEEYTQPAAMFCLSGVTKL